MSIFTIFSKKLSILIALLLLITNYCLSQPNIPVPSKNIILHEKPKDFPKITLEDKKQQVILMLFLINKSRL